MPDNMFKSIEENGRGTIGVLTKELFEILMRGTPLQKGHGRLIDAEQLMNYCQNQIDGHKYADCNVIARFPIIVEADKEAC